MTGTEEAQGVFKWEPTIVGSRATLPCPKNQTANATRVCSYTDETFEIAWKPPDAGACPYGDRRSQDIFNLLQVLFLEKGYSIRNMEMKNKFLILTFSYPMTVYFISHFSYNRFLSGRTNLIQVIELHCDIQNK